MQFDRNFGSMTKGADRATGLPYPYTYFVT